MGCAISAAAPSRWSDSSGCSVSGLLRYAYHKSPETLHPDESLHRLGAAALMAQPIGRRGRWAMALIYGANARIGTGHLANSVAVETNFDLDGMNAVFGRVEYVRKTAEDLVVLSVPPTTEYDVGALALGYRRSLTTVRGVTAGGWGRGAMNFVPNAPGEVFGPRVPPGFTVYLLCGPRPSSSLLVGRCALEPQPRTHRV